MSFSFIADQFEVLRALRHKAFRIFLIGLASQVAGHTIMQVTVGWLAFNLTGSALDLGYVTLAMAIPVIPLTIVGGVLADRWDPRHIITFIQAIAALMVGILAVLSMMDRMELWHLIFSAFVTGSVIAFDQPSQQSLFPRLLPTRHELTNAVPLVGIAWDLNRIVSPAFAGMLIHAGGAGTSFLVSGAGFTIFSVLVQFVRPRKIRLNKSRNSFQNLSDGISYVRKHKLFRILMTLFYMNSLLGLSYIPLLPIFAVEMLNVDARGLGLLAGAGGVGAILGGFLAPRLLHVLPGNRIMLVGTLIFAVGLICFSNSSNLATSMLLIAIVASSSTLVFLVIEIVLQMLVPDHLRGRVMGITTIAWSLPALGAAIVAPIINLTNPSVAVTGAAVVMLINAAAIWGLNPSFRSLKGIRNLEKCEIP